MSRPLLVLFGDSLTQFGARKEGWVQQLQSWYETKADILNRGMSGYNTSDALAMIDEIFLPIKPDIITIMFGSNDVSTGIQCIPIDDFYQNYKKMVLKLKEIHPKAKIVLITPPGLVDTDDRKNDDLHKYAEMITKISEEERVLLCDVWQSFQMQIKWEDFLEDGLHLNSDGNEFMFLEVSNFISNHLEEFSPEKLSFPYKYWRDLYKK